MINSIMIIGPGDWNGGHPVKKASLAMNAKGGEGIELWQYLDRESSLPANEFWTGDLGINILKIKTKYLQIRHDRLSKQGETTLTAIGQARRHALLLYQGSI